MQNIQDKEFDQLFKSQFEEAEIQPSTDLWNSIEPQLDGGSKSKKVIPVYWMAAAVALTALTIGLLFYPSANKQLPSAAIFNKSAVSKPAADKVQKSNATVWAVTLPNAVKAIHHIANADVTITHSSNVDLSIDSAIHSKKDLIAMQPLRDISHPDYKTINIKQDKIVLPKGAPEEIMLASANAPSDGKDEVANENVQKGNKGIRNVGDLVNYVVDKLDKREEKTIQFQTDDDNSSLIAINIGIIKFNQKKQK